MNKQPETGEGNIFTVLHDTLLAMQTAITDLEVRVLRLESDAPDTRGP